MNGSEHYLEGERILLDASFTDTHGNAVTRAGRLMQPGEHESLIRRATVHFAAAQAAATALGAVLYRVGDSDELSAWARITGLLPPRDGVQSRACEFENHTSCAGCSCICHTPEHTCVPFDEPERRRAECHACWDEARKKAVQGDPA